MFETELMVGPQPGAVFINAYEVVASKRVNHNPVQMPMIVDFAIRGAYSRLSRHFDCSGLAPMLVGRRAFGHDR